MRGTVDGLILREIAVGESDKLLTVLTAEYGKILMSAKGVRSMKSKNVSLCRLFTYGNFEFYEKGGKRWLAGGSVNDSFFALSTDIEDFALASYIAEIAGEITGEGVDATDVLRTTLNTFYAIEKKLKPREIIKGAYELFAARVSGFEPDVSACGECGDVYPSAAYLDVMNGSLLCEACILKKHAGHREIPETDRFAARNIFFPLNPSLLASVRYVLGATPSRLFAFELKDDADIKDFSRLGESYLQNHLERGFDTLRFFKTVSEKN